MQLLFVRHGPTEWNDLGLFQGRKDFPLSEKGRQLVAKWHLPDDFKNSKVYSSPLQRATETAEILTRKKPLILPGLTELDYGTLEGTSIELENKRRLEKGQMIDWDSKPGGGESYNEVLQRVFESLHQITENSVIVTHRGILFALTAFCWQWDFKAKKPHHLEPYAFQLFNFEPRENNKDFRLSILSLNIRSDGQ